MIRRIALLVAVSLCSQSLFAGGPLYSGSPTFGVDGQPALWNLAGGAVQYRTDGGPLARRGSTIVIDNAPAIAGVQSMFQVWQDVPTANITFNRAGSVQPVAGFSDGDVSTVNELDALSAACDNQNPATPGQTLILFDADGSMMETLFDPFVIGVTALCQINDAGTILSAQVLMNGRLQDGVDNPSIDNFELTAQEFDQAITHEFGHLSGLDHSQANVEVLDVPFPCDDEDLRGLPIMFPFLACQARVSSGLPPLAPDDVAWISKLYPSASFATSYGTLRGTVYFSDGQTGVQGLNVIARPVDDPLTPADESRRTAFAVVSGYSFTPNPGQSLTGTNTGGSEIGSRDGDRIGYFEMAVSPGNYTLEVEPIHPAFFAGSSVGPLPPIPNPGVDEFWDAAESYFDDPDDATPINVTAGTTVTRDIILNGTANRLDLFEDEALVRPLFGLSSTTIFRSGR